MHGDSYAPHRIAPSQDPMTVRMVEWQEYHHIVKCWGNTVERSRSRPGLGGCRRQRMTAEYWLVGGGVCNPLSEGRLLSPPACRCEIRSCMGFPCLGCWAWYQSKRDHPTLKLSTAIKTLKRKTRKGPPDKGCQLPASEDPRGRTTPPLGTQAANRPYGQYHRQLQYLPGTLDADACR